jgi:hypothetical protein
MPTISTDSIAEILAPRLAVMKEEVVSLAPSEQSLISYLAMCHRRASEEIKTIEAANTKKASSASSTSTTTSNNNSQNKEFLELLQEIKQQVVSFAASSLMEPDLFELAKDGPIQLAQCLIRQVSSLDPAFSITTSVTGTKTSSFYYTLCQELVKLDFDLFQTVIQGIVSHVVDS